MKKFLIFVFFIFFIFPIISCKTIGQKTTDYQHPTGVNSSDNAINLQGESIKILSLIGNGDEDLPYTVFDFTYSFLNSDNFLSKKRFVETKYNCKIEFVSYNYYTEDNFIFRDEFFESDLLKEIYGDRTPNQYKSLIQNDFALDSMRIDQVDTICYTGSLGQRKANADSLLLELYKYHFFEDNDISAIYYPYSYNILPLYKENIFYDFADLVDSKDAVYLQPFVYKSEILGLPVLSFNSTLPLFATLISSDTIELDSTSIDTSEDCQIYGTNPLELFLYYVNSKGYKIADFSNGYFIEEETYNALVDEFIRLLQNHVDLYSIVPGDFGPTDYSDTKITTISPSVSFGPATFAGVLRFDEITSCVARFPIFLDDATYYFEPATIQDIYGNTIDLDKEVYEGIYGIDLSNSSYKSNIATSDGIYLFNNDLEEYKKASDVAVVLEEFLSSPFEDIDYAIDIRAKALKLNYNVGSLLYSFIEQDVETHRYIFDEKRWQETGMIDRFSGNKSFEGMWMIYKSLAAESARMYDPSIALLKNAFFTLREEEWAKDIYGNLAHRNLELRNIEYYPKLYADLYIYLQNAFNTFYE